MSQLVFGGLAHATDGNGVCMFNLAHWKSKVNVSGLSELNDVNDPDAFDDPEDVLISLSSAIRNVYCGRAEHTLIEPLSNGKVRLIPTKEPQRMLVHDTQRRWGIVLADMRSCKRDNAYDIFELNGPYADPDKVLDNPYVTICKLRFLVPTYYCKYCDAESKYTQNPNLIHYHRAVTEWMIWRYQLTMVVFLLIINELMQQHTEKDDYTGKGWIREGNKAWDWVSHNSMIEDLVIERDPGKWIFEDGKTVTLFWLYYIIPPWMKAPCYPLPVFIADTV